MSHLTTTSVQKVRTTCAILRLHFGYFRIFYVQMHDILNFVYFWDIQEHGSLEGFFYISLVRTTTPYEEEYS